MLERTFDSLIGTHDTRLPSWGPYTKNMLAFLIYLMRPKEYALILV